MQDIATDLIMIEIDQGIIFLASAGVTVQPIGPPLIHGTKQHRRGMLIVMHGAMSGLAYLERRV